jgi:hypothetical protein
MSATKSLAVRFSTFDFDRLNFAALPDVIEITLDDFKALSLSWYRMMDKVDDLKRFADVLTWMGYKQEKARDERERETVWRFTRAQEPQTTEVSAT